MLNYVKNKKILLISIILNIVLFVFLIISDFRTTSRVERTQDLESIQNEYNKISNQLLNGKVVPLDIEIKGYQTKRINESIFFIPKDSSIADFYGFYLKVNLNEGKLFLIFEELGLHKP